MTLIMGIIALCVVAVLGLALGIWLLPFLLALLIFSLVVFCFVFWIWMLIDCIKNENIGSTEKVVWVLAIVFTHFLGALIYFFAGRTRRPALNARPMA